MKVFVLIVFKFKRYKIHLLTNNLYDLFGLTVIKNIKLFITIMKSINIIVLLVNVLSYSVGMSQVITDSSESALETIVAIEESSQVMLQENNNEEALIDLEVLKKKINSMYYTDLTLVENNLKIHQVSNKNRLVRIKEVRHLDEVIFYNHLGHKVSTILGVTPRENTVILDLNSFEEGIYFLKFEKHNVIKRLQIN